MAERGDPRNPVLAVLDGLAAIDRAVSVEEALRAAVEVACVATASRRGLAGLFDGEAVTADGWFDVTEGWTRAPMRWGPGEGAPGRVCESGTPLACNDLPETADCLPEATGVLGLTRFACVPLEADGAPVGFIEVGDRPGDYTADEVRCLRAVARRAADGLERLAAAGRREAEERLCSEATLGGRELFSLDPDAVLAEAGARARELTGAGRVTALRLEDERQIAGEDLDPPARAVLEEAVTTGAPAQGDPGVVAVPLAGDERLLGALLLHDVPGPVTGARRAALDALAARACVALEHALLYRTQADIARRLQERMLPLEPPRVPGLDIAVAYRSASHGAGRGGDFIDFYARTDGHLALAVGDVAGKGVEALATTVVVKYALRAAVSGGALSWPVRPGSALQELHNAMLGELEGERFVTLIFALVGVRRRTLELATAGHPAPFVVRAGVVERPLLLTAPAIGVDLEAALTPYPSEALDLEAGDCVVFFTDGVTELRDRGGRFFEEEMPAVLGGLHGRPATEVVAALLDEAGRFTAQAPADDMAVVCLRLADRPAVGGRAVAAAAEQESGAGEGIPEP